MAIYADHDHLRYVLLAYHLPQSFMYITTWWSCACACVRAYVYVRILTVQT